MRPCNKANKSKTDTSHCAFLFKHVLIKYVCNQTDIDTGTISQIKHPPTQKENNQIGTFAEIEAMSISK